MSNPSNLYAEQVFSEHPLALWPLDETVDYLSIATENAKDISNSDYWSESNCDIELDLSQTIYNNSVYKITSDDSDSFEIFSENMISTYISQDLNSIDIGFYGYFTQNISSVDFGYRYDEAGIPRYTNSAEMVHTVSDIDQDKWKFISYSFDLPDIETVSFAIADIAINPGSATKLNMVGHGFNDGDKIKFSASFDLPSQLNEYSIYYVVNADDDSFEVESEIGSGGIEFQNQRFGVLNVLPIKNITPFIRFNNTYPQSSTVNVGGFAIGQWAKEFFDSSSGVSVSEITSINIPKQYFGISTDAYGLGSNNGYYLCRENKLLAKNINMPIVYGSSSVTSLLPERFNGPSLIVPGNGMLNESGRYRTYTLEFWLRINPNTTEPKRIFGPINSNDGIYVNGPFFTVKVGDSIESHYVGEWYRPMLINFIIFKNGASLLINSEKVIDISFDSASIDLPSKTSLAGKDQDWLGFYSYDDIDKFEIDCISIYSYRVPSAVSKRRWVYGQAVTFPQELASSYNGESFSIDYSVSNYSNNYIYPDRSRWQQGKTENISTKNNVLSPPNYSLPDIVFNNKTSDSWIRSISNNSSPGLMLKPDSSWVDTDGYLFFKKIDLLDQKTAGFYMAAELPIGFSGSETLFRIENSLTGNYLSSTVVSDSKNISSIDSEIIECASHGLLDNDIISFSGNLPIEVAENKEYFVIYVSDNYFSISDTKGGDPISISAVTENDVQINFYSIEYRLLFGSTPETLIYKTRSVTSGSTFVAGIHFSSFSNYFGKNVASLLSNKSQLNLYVGGDKTFTKTFSGYIYRVGFCSKYNLSLLDYLFASNGLPFLRYQFDGGESEIYIPDEIVNAGYVYEDYIDDILSHKASYTLAVKKFFNEKYLDIETNSYWQDYIPLSYFAKLSTDSFGNKKYAIDFMQINMNSIVPEIFDNNEYDTSDFEIKCYVSFQLVSSGATVNINSFDNTERLNRSKIVKPGSEWVNTKYEVLNGSLLYIPEGISIDDLALVIYVEIRSNGIIKNPIRLRSLKIVSKTIDETVANPIKTKFGSSIFPHIKYGFYYDYSKYNPYIIYSDSTPHLYLNKQSGIELTGTFGELDRGIAFRVNTQKLNSYDLSAIQFSAKFNRPDIVTSPVSILEIDNSIDNIKIFIEPSKPSSSRFNLYATDKNNNKIDSVVFYINGKQSLSPTITIAEWNMIGIGFISPIGFEGISGSVRITGPILMNNITYYALDQLQRLDNQFININEYAGVDLGTIYNVFTGTNKTIVVDDIALKSTEYRYAIENTASLQASTIKPV